MCIDMARDAAKMMSEGKELAWIRSHMESKYKKAESNVSSSTRQPLEKH